MKQMSPWELKPLVDKHKLEGAVLITTDGEQYAVVSFGSRRDNCAKFKAIGDQIGELIDSGEIEMR